MLFNDGPVFLALAEAFRSGAGWAALGHPYHPLYPAAMAAVSQLGCSLESAAVGVSIFGGLLTLAGLFVFLDWCFDRQVAKAGAWIAALHPWAVDFSSDVMSDSLYAGFYSCALAALAIHLATERRRAALCCGAFIALAYGVRPEGLGGLAVAVVACWGTRLSEVGGKPRGLRGLVPVIGVAVLLIFPYVLFLSVQAGQPTLSAKKSVSALAKGVSDPAAVRGRERWDQPAPASARIWLPASSESVSGPGAVRPAADLGGVATSAGRAVRTALAAYRYELVLAALLGLWACHGGRLPRPPSRAAWIVGASLLLYTGLLVLLVWGAGYVSRRHALAPWFPLLGYSVLGGRWVWEIAGRRWGFVRRAPTFAPLVVLVAALVLAWGPRDLRARREDRLAVRMAAEWLAEHHPNSGPVAAQKLRTAYYAEASFVPLGPGTRLALRDELGAAGARWLVIDDTRLGDHRGLEAGEGSWLRRAHQVVAAGRSASVYALQSKSAGAGNAAP